MAPKASPLLREIDRSAIAATRIPANSAASHSLLS
ncbi:hypothetical protein RHAB21_02836 [Pseudorhizobium halotolerans]|uniref:Uncharacterized protein n=1 Tax=Pseudorhizobium halotolerans TaxID=1233081 RepID=A0ABM8PMZ9_9HYPH|nr:hypothetical protein RHAB21_02836 [Pseudorhizobium halotolerans]